MASWLDGVAAAAAEGAPLLVVCRTGATVRAVYRRLAEEATQGRRAGFADLQVTTIRGLVAAAAPRPLKAAPTSTDGDVLPDGHPWRELLRERPGLTRELRTRMGLVHEAAAASVTLENLRPELRALLDAGWGRPASLEGMRRLLSAPKAAARCLAVGFAPGEFSFLGGFPRADRALLARLGATLIDAGDPTGIARVPIEALRLPDTAAEARAAAVKAAGAAAGSSILVLVASEATGDRVRAALRRNGITSAADGALPLTRHSLVSILTPLLPVFASQGREPLEARNLIRLCTDPVLARTAPKSRRVKGDGGERPRASVRHVRDMILSCRRVRATLDEWIAALGEIERQRDRKLKAADEESKASAANRLASAQVLLALVQALAENARGGGRLGDMARFLSDVELSDPKDDRLGRAIRGRLSSEGYRPADPDSYAEALGDALASGRVDDGVQVLPYASYDGRGADLLLLLDVHGKGIAHAPAPDPFFTPMDQRLLGIPPPLEMIQERLAIARWASTRARRTLAIVAETDATGRRVSRPVDLDLTLDEHLLDASYGLSFELPERADCQVLGIGLPERDDFCTQVDAEWARRGATVGEPHPEGTPAEETGSLLDYVRKDLLRIPDDLLPFLGKSGATTGGDGLPQGFTLSASRLGHFTNCLYRAFCRSVLGLRPQEDVKEDLDAKEVGTAVHRALQQGLQGVRLVVPQAHLDLARREAMKRLERATEAAVEEEVKDRPAGSDTPPISLARQGVRSRWQRHWAHYLERRIISLEEAEEEARGAALEDLEESEFLTASVDALCPGLKPTPRDDFQGNLLGSLGRHGGDIGGILLDSGLFDGIAPKNVSIISEAMSQPVPRAKLEALCATARERLTGVGFAPDGDMEIVAAELAFGLPGGKEPTFLQMGRSKIAVSGSIDAIAQRQGTPGLAVSPCKVIDYKTGRTKGVPAKLLDNLLDPQLAFYAIVLEGAQHLLTRKDGRPLRVEAIERDGVRALDMKEVAFGETDRERVHKVLGALLDHARDGSYPLIPHPQGCPLLKPFGTYCDFQEICRLRPQYSSPEVESAEEVG